MSWQKAQKKSKKVSPRIPIPVGDWDQMYEIEQRIVTILDHPKRIVFITRFEILKRLKQKYADACSYDSEDVLGALYDYTLQKYLVGHGEKPKYWSLRRQTV